MSLSPLQQLYKNVKLSSCNELSDAVFIHKEPIKKREKFSHMNKYAG